MVSAGDYLSRCNRIGGTNSNKAVTIKSHHNVGGLPDKLNLKLIEPLRDLFKDEVRKLVSSWVCLNQWSTDILFRSGPRRTYSWGGYSDFAEILRHADAIFIEELKNQVVLSYPKLSQSFCLFDQ